MSVITKDLGAVTAYAAAVNRGYTGTKEEFETLMASYATVAQQAAESAQAASSSAQGAFQAASSANTAMNNTRIAESNAQSAASGAQGYAQYAQQSAQSASRSATDAESAKNTAVEAVDGFAAGAQQALDGVNQAGNNWKSLAERQAENSEAYALGTRDGEDVGSSDPTYHNNAKYYAESVSASAQTASNAAQTAAIKAGEAAQSASAAAESARTLTIDAVPTQGSTNAVSSGGVWDETTNLKEDLMQFQETGDMHFDPADFQVGGIDTSTGDIVPSHTKRVVMTDISTAAYDMTITADITHKTMIAYYTNNVYDNVSNWKANGSITINKGQQYRVLIADYPTETESTSVKEKVSGISCTSIFSHLLSCVASENETWG